MNFDKYTIKAQELLQKAADVAAGNGQQAIETGHLLKGILLTDENVMTFLIKKLGISQQLLENKLEELLGGYPKVSGQQPYLSNDSASALQRAEKELKTFGDEFIAVEHVILGLLTGKDKTASILKDTGFDKNHLIEAIKELRGGDTVTDQNAESKYRSLERYSNNL
ncbi:MAG: Clp protease N-terminal domain-containing protein, partial [Bacteroidota bacterium]